MAMSIDTVNAFISHRVQETGEMSKLAQDWPSIGAVKTLSLIFTANALRKTGKASVHAFYSLAIDGLGPQQILQEFQSWQRQPNSIFSSLWVQSYTF